MSEITRILKSAEQGDSQAAEALLPLVYDELRKLAAARLAREPSGNTLQPTALVHEVWLRVAGAGPTRWDSRGHFFAAAGEAMRRILIERARRKQAQRRGGEFERAEFDEARLVFNEPADQVLAVNDALDQLNRQDALCATLVKLRYFVGMTLPEAAQALAIPPRTADRLWSYARTWLRIEIEKNR